MGMKSKFTLLNVLHRFDLIRSSILVEKIRIRSLSLEWTRIIYLKLFRRSLATLKRKIYQINNISMKINDCTIPSSVKQKYPYLCSFSQTLQPLASHKS